MSGEDKKARYEAYCDVYGAYGCAREKLRVARELHEVALAAPEEGTPACEADRLYSKKRTAQRVEALSYEVIECGFELIAAMDSVKDITTSEIRAFDDGTKVAPPALTRREAASPYA
jgi:hypothetical protein